MAERLPLEHDDSIRLLKLHYESFFPKLHATLENVRRSESLNYTALSYAWGDATDSGEIVINGHVSLIRKNLWKFLEVLSRRREDLWLWVDALCIRQDSTEEKNHQVSRIGQTFSQAKQVYGWLGNELDIGLKLACINAAKDESGIGLDDAEAIAESKYWQRTWVVQECTLARRLILFSGKYHCDASWLRVRGSEGNGSRRLLNMKQIMTVRPAAPARSRHMDISLLDLVSRFSMTKCTIPQDMVFALQSVAIAECRCDVDYESEIGILFWQALARNTGQCSFFHAENLRHALRISWEDIAKAVPPNAGESWRTSPTIAVNMEWGRHRPESIRSGTLICGCIDQEDDLGTLKGADSVILVFPPPAWNHSPRLKGVYVVADIAEHEQHSWSSSDEWVMGVECNDPYSDTPKGMSTHMSPLIFQRICDFEYKHVWL